MFASSSIALLLSATAVMASAHQARSHNAIALRKNNSTDSLEKRDSFVSKEMTWYPTDTGPDACTGKNHQDSDFYVAMGYDQFGDGSGCCGRQLRINFNGKSAVATCVDECASCPQWGQIDLTKGLFKYFTNGDLDVGVIYGSWSYVDGNDDGGDSDPTTTTKKTTTKAAPTTHHTTTTTPEPEPTTTKEAPVTHKEAVKATTTPKSTTTSTKASSSKKASSSSAKHSSSKVSSSAKPSSSAKTSSSAKPSASASPSVAAPSTTPAGGVANVGGSSSSESNSGDEPAAPIAGGLGTGSESGAASFGFNKLLAAVAVVALAAVQAL